MKSILLFLCFIAYSYCLLMTPVSINSKTYLPTTGSEKKYFYLTNNDYYSYSSYIYICLEDNNFGLYNDIKYCRTNTNPSIYPDNAVGCSFITTSPYSTQISSGTPKYYYRISTTNSYIYSIVFYQGSFPDGNLYVTSDYKDLTQTVKMTQVSKNSRTSLPTTNSIDKYFYLTNSDYYSYSSYIYICFEDQYLLNYNNIKYCYSNTNPSSNPDYAVNGCTFITTTPYSTQSSSNIPKYYYKIPTTSSYTYSIVYYEGSHSSGNLYVTCDYNELVKTIKMTQLYRKSKTSISTNSSEEKYFYLTNGDYYPYSNYIYICLQDNNFNLKYNEIKYCQTNTNPTSYPDNAISGCSFSVIYGYYSRSFSSTIKYYYKIPTTGSYTYSIVYYEGGYSSGYLYVTSDYNDLDKKVRMTQVYRNSKTYLPTTSSEDKYFYLTNSNYYSYSSNIYVRLDDNNFGLYNDDIKYCHTNTDPSTYPDDAVNGCSFSSINYYSTQSSSGTTKYYYTIPITNYYTYSIVYYEGGDTSGILYVTSDYNNILNEDNKGMSAGAIIGIVVGLIIFIAALIIIIRYCLPRCRKNKINFIPVTQPYFDYQNSNSYASNQPNMFNPIYNPNMQLQAITVPNEAD